MPRRTGIIADRPPPAPVAFDVKAPFAAASVGSIVRPSTSPIVGLYNAPGAAVPNAAVGMRFGGRQADDDGPAAPDPLQEPASTRLLRRTSNGARRSSVAAAPLSRPSTSGSQGVGPVEFSRREPIRGSQVRMLREESPADAVDMMVEGVQTGEERTAAAEQPKEKPLAARTLCATRSRSFDQGQRDRAMIRRLEQEVGRLRTLCEGQGKQLAELRNAETATAALREEVRSCRDRAERAERAQREEEERRKWSDTRQQRVQEDLERLLRDERQRLTTIRGDAEDREVESRIRCRELEDRAESAGRERDDLRRRVQEFEAEVRMMRDRSLEEKLSLESKDREIGDLGRQQRTREQMICQLKAALAEDASTVERVRAELREVREEQVRKEAELIERRRKAEQFQEYVLKICQPHFAVVKDESLCPVNVSGFQVTEGYVLVPLILLLEGYALLPPQLKMVIDAKSSKLAKGIDYSSKVVGGDFGPRSNEKQSYKDKLYSMMDEKGDAGARGSASGSRSASRGHLGISDKLQVSSAQKQQRGVAATSSGGWCVGQRGQGLPHNVGRDGRATQER
eukprot:TRINITY_DN6653_c0_g1_i3.p1 TRINITY_DN6653_c0_g1~~TRINITY_DN6653_c0_g1_i3.p1  ORF type:complete len:570 (+),score=205.31 TRINITY_DN6653_c0_g1_i3:66-1775(+)